MRQFANRPIITLGVALVGAGVVAAAPGVNLARGQLFDVVLTSGAENITVDFVRHGESTDNVSGILGLSG